MPILAITAITSGVLVLLGWFTLPVRIVLLISIGIATVHSYIRASSSSSRGDADVSREVRRTKWEGSHTDVPRGHGVRFLTEFILSRVEGFEMTKGVGAAAALLAAIMILWSSGTTDPIRSPWSIVPAPFFFLYALMAVVAVVRSTPRTSYFLLLTSSSVAILVYPLGFGFDHFIHAAAERIIATTGALSPPPLFYSGHYGLTILLADLLPWVDVALADRLLAPILTIALLVPLAYRSLSTVLPEREALLGTSSLLIVPFLPLAVSTPQATANIFALATVLLLLSITGIVVRGTASPPVSFNGIVQRRTIPYDDTSRDAVKRMTMPDGEVGARPQLGAVPLLTALAAFLSQPMTGIIAIAVVAMTFAWQRGWRILSAAVAILGAIGIPLAFAIAGRIIPNLDLLVTFNPLPAMQRLGTALADVVRITAVDFSTADALTIARIILPLLWFGLAVGGARALAHQSTPKNQVAIRKPRPLGKYGNSFLLIAPPLIALVAAALVAATVMVPTQLGEEQSQFPLRLVQLAVLLATPLVSIGLGTVLDRVRGRLPQLAAAVAIGAAATFTLLLAYPRDDAQARSGLWSVSADDIAAVHAIAEDAGDARYVVLANQMLGAAAIREFGFRPAHTVANSSLITRNSSLEILAFPLPAGGPIARKYWEYVTSETPTRAPIDAAMDLVNADRAYVVLHSYWRNYERLAAATATLADTEIGSFTHLRVFRLTHQR